MRSASTSRATRSSRTGSSPPPVSPCLAPRWCGTRMLPPPRCDRHAGGGKPLDGNHGRGVMLHLAERAAVRDGYRVARGRPEPRRLGVVESFLTGNDYRCLVVDALLRRVAQRVPAHAKAKATTAWPTSWRSRNAEPAARHRPREGADPHQARRRVLAYSREQVSSSPTFRERPARLPQAHRNMSTGGISIDRTRRRHPDNVELAELAARVAARHRGHRPDLPT